MKKYILALILLVVAIAAQAHSWRGHRHHRHHHHHPYGYVAAFHHGYMAYQYYAHPHHFSMMYVARPRPAVRVVYDYGYSEYEDSDFSSSYEEIPYDEAYEQTAPANEANERPNGRTSAPAAQPSAPAASTNSPSKYFRNFSYDPFDPDKKPKYDPYEAEYLQLVADNANLEEYLEEAIDWVNEAYDYFLRFVTAYSKTPNLTDVQKKRYKEAKEIVAQTGNRKHTKIVHKGNAWKRLSTEEKIVQLKADSKKLHAEEEELNALVDKYELLYLKLVNDFLKEAYTDKGYKNAKELLDRVNFDKDKDGFQALLENYKPWLFEIVNICNEAMNDYMIPENRADWKNPRNSRADVFIKQLDKCQYSRRADKDWSIPYFDDLITKVKARMNLYKTPQNSPMTFDDILPKELSKRQKVTTKSNDKGSKGTTIMPGTGKRVKGEIHVKTAS